MCAVSDVFKMVVRPHLATAREIIKILSGVEVLHWTEIDLFFHWEDYKAGFDELKK